MSALCIWLSTDVPLPPQLQEDGGEGGSCILHHNLTNDWTPCEHDEVEPLLEESLGGLQSTSHDSVALLYVWSGRSGWVCMCGVGGLCACGKVR